MNTIQCVLISTTLISASILIKNSNATVNSYGNNEMISSYGTSLLLENGTSTTRYGFFHIKGNRVRDCYEKNTRIKCDSWQRIN